MDDNYEIVACEIRSYLDEMDLKNFTKSEYEEKYKNFYEMFSPEVLANLNGKDVLNKIFLGTDEKNLCYVLEYSSEYMFCGSIKGRSSYKYSLYKSKDERWVKGTSSKNKQYITETEAIQVAIKIRDAIVKGADYIKKANLNDIDDYYILGQKLFEIFEDCQVKPTDTWIHKYYSIIFPDYIPICHQDEMKKNMIRKLHLEPSDDFFENDGQLYMLSKKAGIKLYSLFDEQIVGLFYRWETDMWKGFDKHNLIGVDNAKYWVISSGPDANRWNLFSEEKVIAIGWDWVGNLNNYENTKEDKKKIKDRIFEVESKKRNIKQGDSKSVNAILRFSKEMKIGDYVFAKEGNKKIRGFGKVISDYFYDKNIDNKIDGDLYSHFRKVIWFSEGEWDLIKPFRGQFTLKELEGVELKNLLEQFDVKGEELNMKNNLEKNKIYFGAPGTGKSHKLNLDKELLFDDNNGTYERVTFHPDYTYANFVGTYKPVPTINGHGEEDITYKYVPGPFMRMLVESFRYPENNYLVLIEEINRANVAAVFGDIFQLLDRLTEKDEKENKDIGDSEYDIHTSEDMRDYLRKELDSKEENKLKEFDYERVWIPKNLYLYATMNSADQGVFPMDTAFKRRWDFEYMDIDNNAIYDGIKYSLGTGDYNVEVSWNTLREAINKQLKTFANEDKLLGYYFITKNLDEIGFKKVFKNKVLMYLFEDVAKGRPNDLFDVSGDERVFLSDIQKDFDDNGKGIYVFCENITNEITGGKVETEE